MGGNTYDSARLGMSAVWLRLCVDRGLVFGQTVEVAHCRGCPTLPERALRLAAARKSDARNFISHRRPGPAPTAMRPSVSRARRRPIASAWRTAKPTSACRAQATLRWSWRKSRPTNSIPIPRAPEARRAQSAFPSRSSRSGRVGSAAIIHSSGFAELDSAAREILRSIAPPPPPVGSFSASTTIRFHFE
jgi:hypothetical protein